MVQANPRIYLSGRFSTGKKIEAAWLKRTGCTHRCFSFATLHPEAVNYSKVSIEALAVCEKKGIGIMMDSGAHTLHAIERQSKQRSAISDKQKTIDAEALKDDMYERYVEYCHENNSKWDFYVTLDYKRHQPTILRMQKRFIADGLLPVPVYHGDKGLDWLSKYKDLGCNLIALSTGNDIRGKVSYKNVRFYFDRVFEYAAKHNLKLHGLAITSLGMLTAYPWWSVDSSTWVRSSIYGMITFPDQDKNTIYNIHISERKSTGQTASYNNMSRRQRHAVEATIKDFGFTLKEIRDAKDGLEGRHDWNGKVFANVFDLIDTTKQKHVAWERLI